MEDDISQMGLSFLKMFGEYMHYKSIKLHIWRAFNIIALVIALWFTAANLGHATGAGYMRTIEGISTLLHIQLKYLFIIYYKPNIENILDARSKFWKYENISSRTSQQLKLTFGRVKYAQIYLMSTMSFAIFMYWLKPYFNNDTIFMYDCWIYPDSLVLETIVLACQYYTLGTGIPIVLGCDFLYLTYTVQYAVQLRLLNHKFRKTNISTTTTELYGYVRQHQVLLSIFKRISSIYFWMLLFHYIITLATGFCQLYIIILRKTNSKDIVASLIYNIGLYVEFGYYAFPAHIIVSELRGISNAIYESFWYEQDIKIQKVLLLVMMQAQKQKYMSVGGIIEMNVDILISILAISISLGLLKNCSNSLISAIASIGLCTELLFEGIFRIISVVNFWNTVVITSFAAACFSNQKLHTVLEKLIR